MPDGNDTNLAVWGPAIAAFSAIVTALFSALIRKKKIEHDFTTAGEGYAQLYEQMRAHIAQLEKREKQSHEETRAAQARSLQLEHIMHGQSARLEAAERAVLTLNQRNEHLRGMVQTYEQAIANLRLEADEYKTEAEAERKISQRYASQIARHEARSSEGPTGDLPIKLDVEPDDADADSAPITAPGFRAKVVTPKPAVTPKRK